MDVLDRLPAWAHDLLMIFGGTFAGAVLNAVVDAKGVTAVAWHETLMGAVDGSFYAAAVAGFTLYVTPLTKKYGVKGFKKTN